MATVQVPASRLTSMLANRRKSPEAFAEELGWDVAKVKGILDGVDTIDAKDLESMAVKLHKPWMYLLIEEEEILTKQRINTRTHLNENVLPDAELVDELIWLNNYLENIKVVMGSERALFPRIIEAENEEVTASLLRNDLGISWKKQLSQKDNYSSLKLWVEAIEQKNIYVVQHKITDPKIRAYSKIDGNTAVIVLNTEDPYPRLFSLIHEYCHIVLNKDSFCDMRGKYNQNERECNSIAAKILMPYGEFTKDIKEHVSSLKSDDIEEAERTLKRLSNNYHVSQQALLIRLQETSLISLKTYALLETRRKSRRRSSSGSGGDYYKSSINRVGRRYAMRVLELFHDKKLSGRDTAHLLGVGQYNLTSFTGSLYGEQKS